MTRTPEEWERVAREAEEWLDHLEEIGLDHPSLTVIDYPENWKYVSDEDKARIEQARRERRARDG